ncbi:MAG: hypothetical protein KAU28_03710, partial [Phycisphaerae bacterium]|nr:hypothetical protein [Phycisphaerae bacterium]
TLRRLNSALETESDTKFAAIVNALRRAGKFASPQRDPLQIDRMRAIEIATTRSQKLPEAAASTREIILREVILCGRDNKYVRQALGTAASDEVPLIRGLSAALAARLGNDATLQRLLGDEDAGVVAAAALDAGLAGRKTLTGTIAKLLDAANGIEVVSSAALAGAILEPPKFSARICDLLEKTDDKALRDRLLHVMTLLNDEDAAAAVMKAVLSACRAGGHPPAAALLAAGKLRLKAAAPQVRAVLKDAASKRTELFKSQLLAAIDAAERLKLPVRAEMLKLVRKCWHLQLTMMSATRLLGRQAELPQPGQSRVPSAEDCIAALRQVAVFETVVTAPGGEAEGLIRTPMPSAAAAVALWLMEADPDDIFVRTASAVDTPVPGDYIAWHLAAAAPERAFRLGME